MEHWSCDTSACKFLARRPPTSVRALVHAAPRSKFIAARAGNFCRGQHSGGSGIDIFFKRMIQITIFTLKNFKFQFHKPFLQICAGFVSPWSEVGAAHFDRNFSLYV